MKIYAMSDIHGCFEEFLDALNFVDLDDKNNMLIFLGDYIHGGGGSYNVLDKIMKLENKYGSRVVALMGNHEEWVIEQNHKILDDGYDDEYDEEREEKYIRWMEKLPLYYETDNQIFVHAGVEEEAGEDWEIGTADYVYTEKYPASIGKFYKDIVAGHISTASITNDPKYRGIYFDGESHYYIDGDVLRNGYITILMYDTKINKYYEVTENGIMEIAS